MQTRQDVNGQRQVTIYSLPFNSMLGSPIPSKRKPCKGRWIETSCQQTPHSPKTTRSHASTTNRRCQRCPSPTRETECHAKEPALPPADCINRRTLRTSPKNQYDQKPPSVRSKFKVSLQHSKMAKNASPRLTTKSTLPGFFNESVYLIAELRQFNRIPMRPQTHQQPGRYSTTAINHQPYNQQDMNSPWVLRTSAVDTFILRNDSLKAAKRRSWAHVEQNTSTSQQPHSQRKQHQLHPNHKSSQTTSWTTAQEED